jgi:redox-sensing transcriptional repressor
MNRTKTAGIPTLKRMPSYLRLLKEIKADGKEYASGAFIARALGLDPIVVRKDLAITGVVGKPRLGFPTNEIILAINQFLGWTNRTDAVLAGAGALGSALLGYEGFKQHGLQIVAAFDADPEIVGSIVRSREIMHISKLTEMAERMKIQIGILTVPVEVAQEVADAMVAGGIRGIWNFTPVKLNVPDYVILQRQDLASSLAVLSHKLYLDAPEI